MDKARIKVILASYRPGSDDGNDPLFRAALDELANDSELAEWFRLEQQFDAAMVEKFREVPVEPGAKERILNAFQQSFADFVPGPHNEFQGDSVLAMKRRYAPIAHQTDDLR